MWSYFIASALLSRSWFNGTGQGRRKEGGREERKQHFLMWTRYLLLSCLLSHFNLPTNLWHGCLDSHFTDEETEIT